LPTIDTARQSVTVLDRLWAKGQGVSLGDILRDPSDRERALACVCLVALQGEEETIMPGPDYELRPGCQILFAGALQAQRMLDAALNNEYTLSYWQEGGPRLMRRSVLRRTAARGHRDSGRLLALSLRLTRETVNHSAGAKERL
jgi:hypothetical protein